MLRKNSLAMVALACASAVVLSMSGCKKDDKEAESIPVPSSSAATPVAANSGEAAAADSAGAGTAAPQPVAPNPTPVTTAKTGGSIDACCAAIGGILKSGKDATAKGAAARAAAICPGIAARVKSGETSRAAGLTLIKGSLAGASIPPECH